MRIVIICEGATEMAFREILQDFIEERHQDASSGADRVGIDPRPQDGAVPSGEKLKRLVENYLQDGDVKAVIVLKDMYPEFNGLTANEAKKTINEDCGNNPRVFPHVAKHDFEAWLIPFWDEIISKLEIKKKRWGNNPEDINQDNPPAHRFQELFQLAKPKRRFKKPIDGPAILRGKDLTIAAGQCPEFKAFLNTILRLSSLPEIP